MERGRKTKMGERESTTHTEASAGEAALGEVLIDRLLMALLTGRFDC